MWVLRLRCPTSNHGNSQRTVEKVWDSVSGSMLANSLLASEWELVGEKKFQYSTNRASMKVYGKKKETAATAKVKLAAKYSNRDMDWKVFIRYLFARH